MAGHHEHDLVKARCLIIVVSDTRTLGTDEGGLAIAQALEQAGHLVLDRVVVRDEVTVIRDRVLEAAEKRDADVVLLTGGTGITRRDVTPEAVLPLLTHDIPGFGEALRRAAEAEVGPSGLLSRGFAGVVAGTLVFALPGTPQACRSIMKALVLPLLPHAVAMAQR